MTLGRLLWLVRRDVARGWRATYHDYITAPKITAARPFVQAGAAGSVPVHLLTGKDTWLMSCWMLASWFVQTGRNWQVVIHDDGSLEPAHAEIFKRLFGSVTMVWRTEADARMESFLATYTRCLAYRRKHPLGLKAFDIPVYAEGDRYIMLDSDVLFFKRPAELLAWVDDPSSHACWFNADAQEPAPLTAAEAEERLGVRLWSKVNSGLCAFHKDMADFDFFEKCLNDEALLGCKEWRVEQTILALAASRLNKGGLLPETYEVSLGDWMLTDAVARHYVGAVRQRFYAEGLGKLAKDLLRA